MELERENRLLLAALLYEQGHPRRTQHILKVYALAKLIGEGEALMPEELEILAAAAILHDIPIRRCKERYGDACQENQRREAPEMVESFLREAGYPAGVSQKVLPLVLLHHQYGEADRDKKLRILMEADLLVNYLEKEEPISPEQLQGFFQTATGRQLAKAMSKRPGRC